MTQRGHVGCIDTIIIALILTFIVVHWVWFAVAIGAGLIVAGISWWLKKRHRAAKETAVPSTTSTPTAGIPPLLASPVAAASPRAYFEATVTAFDGTAMNFRLDDTNRFMDYTLLDVTTSGLAQAVATGSAELTDARKQVLQQSQQIGEQFPGQGYGVRLYYGTNFEHLLIQAHNGQLDYYAPDDPNF
ncbi:hypothetical protein D1831_04430 [Lactiplantibacillus garii]|uniref:Uncharacterized protein n=1 Tax=Lactiplantibacillus garii TaxID=2306423 RepID=A0A3R8KFW3_9LACO|nr:hypothetical protein [Lactiplantibacillus garii]RRK11065.1 hypothetical protein D1831_04430 [Lactiplantibacillus garii]